MDHGNISAKLAASLLKLKARIDAANIPPSRLDESINIATWNIREFGKKRRREESIHFIAEIISQFDLVGLVELRDNLADLGRVLALLGNDWRAVYSDMIPDAGGNRERIAFLYDRRAVVFNGLAAEATAPRRKVGLHYLPENDFWRAPYMASFRSGTLDFVVLTTHAQWGTEEGREEELGLLADWIEGKRRDAVKEDKDLIVMGDFNIPSRTSKHYKAITKHGLQVPKGLLLKDPGTNLEKDKRYDQILHYPEFDVNFSDKGGVLDFFIDTAHIKELFPDGLTKEAFTYQLSDHLPLWTQLNTDVSGQRLEQIVQG
ncbi:MAG: endonuclease/exonuclease/phosphatase family protein [Flavobacteriales bacterium]|nr:endonuclease/exonuclease/phosphatase family protein [Flavobacteriales bacterium]MCC6938911.1 endonuclease/exonuclease/phosphatase family protein [Flavobacteriales bacterium]